MAAEGSRLHHAHVPVNVGQTGRWCGKVWQAVKKRCPVVEPAGIQHAQVCRRACGVPNHASPAGASTAPVESKRRQWPLNATEARKIAWKVQPAAEVCGTRCLSRYASSRCVRAGMVRVVYRNATRSRGKPQERSQGGCANAAGRCVSGSACLHR